MNKFLETLKSEFYVDGTTSIKHTIRANPQRDTFSITLKYYNEDAELINQSCVRFTKNQLPKPQKLLFQKNSHKEIENLFLYAKDEIIASVINDHSKSINNYNAQINQLRSLTNVTLPSIVIPDIPEPLTPVTKTDKSDLKNKM